MNNLESDKFLEDCVRPKQAGGCGHKNWTIQGDAPVGKGLCTDCQKHICLCVLFENMRKRLQALIVKQETHNGPM